MRTSFIFNEHGVAQLNFSIVTYTKMNSHYRTLACLFELAIRFECLQWF